MCGCALWNKKSYLLSFNEHIIQEIDLSLVYWQPNPLYHLFPINDNVLIWGLDIDTVKFFDEYMQLVKNIFSLKIIGLFLAQKC